MRRWLPAVLTALLAGCIPAPPAQPPRELRVATLNLYHDAANWPARQPLVIEQLRALDADVIALQEVLQTASLPNQAGTIAAGLGYAWRFVSIDPPQQARRYGNALLTRLPIRSHDWHHLQPRDDARSIGRVRVELDGRPLDVYFTHLHWTTAGGAIRRRQLEDAVAWMARGQEDVPALLLGDFNATADAPELQPLAGFFDVHAALHPGIDRSGATTLNPHFFPDRRARIDLVFAQAGRFEAREAGIVLDRPDAAGTWPSDHFGVLATLRLLDGDAAR